MIAIMQAGHTAQTKFEKKKKKRKTLFNLLFTLTQISRLWVVLSTERYELLTSTNVHYSH